MALSFGTGVVVIFLSPRVKSPTLTTLERERENPGGSFLCRTEIVCDRLGVPRL